MESPGTLDPSLLSPNRGLGFSGLSPDPATDPYGAQAILPDDMSALGAVYAGAEPYGAGAPAVEEEGLEQGDVAGEAMADGELQEDADTGSEGEGAAGADADLLDDMGEMHLVFGTHVCRAARERNLHVVRVPAPPVLAEEPRAALAGEFRRLLLSLCRNAPAPAPRADRYGALADTRAAAADWDDPMELTSVLAASAECEAERIRRAHGLPAGPEDGDGYSDGVGVGAVGTDAAHAYAAWNAQLHARGSVARDDEAAAHARRYATLARVALDLETAARAHLDAAGPAAPAAPVLHIATDTVAHTVPCTAADAPDTYDIYAKRLHRVLHDVSALATALLCGDDDGRGAAASVALAPVLMVDYCGERMLVARVPAQTGLLAGAPDDVRALLGRGCALLGRDIAAEPLLAVPEVFAGRLAAAPPADAETDAAAAAAAVGACVDTLLRTGPQLLCGAGSARELAAVLHARGLRMRQLGALHDALRARGQDAGTGAARARAWAAVVAAEMLARAFCKEAAALLRRLVRARARDTALRAALVDHVNALLAGCVASGDDDDSSSGSSGSARNNHKHRRSRHCAGLSGASAALWGALNARLARGEPVDAAAMLRGARHAVPHLFAVVSAKLGLVWDAALTAGVARSSSGAAFFARQLPLAPAQLRALVPRVVHANAACHALGVAATPARPWPSRTAHATVAAAAAAARAFLAAAAEQPWNGASLRRLARACEDAARALALRQCDAADADAADAATGFAAASTAHAHAHAPAIALVVPPPAALPVRPSAASCVRHAQLHYALAQHARVGSARARLDAAVFRAGVLDADAGALQCGPEARAWALGAEGLVAHEQCSEALECYAQHGAAALADGAALNGIAAACCVAGDRAWAAGAALLRAVLRAPDDVAVLANCAEYCRHVLHEADYAALFADMVRRRVPDFSFAWLDTHTACNLGAAALSSLDF